MTAVGAVDPFGDLPAPIRNPEAWPPNYADGWNDAVRHMVDAFPLVRANFAAPAPPPADSVRALVDEAMVERALVALVAYRNTYRTLDRDGVRAALQAALSAAPAHTCDFMDGLDDCAACKPAAPAGKEAIPAGVYYSIDSGNFHDARTRKGMGLAFFGAWESRRSEFPAAAPTPEGDRAAKYDELLLAVARKYPGESRHETALRYIRERENAASEGAAQQEGGRWPKGKYCIVTRGPGVSHD